MKQVYSARKKGIERSFRFDTFFHLLHHMN